MTYQVLARKWRPKNFHEVAGQAHVLQTLTHALEQQRLHHAYLFTGTRGVGKTTVARILARCLNCEQGITATPCGECDACREITEGRFIDLIEVDAASRTRVEDTRELLENVQYAPSGGRFKVYLIDEVHMLSTHSFNALLKTLEEPPPHVKFLLATTDPQKLPVTVLSRCLQFHLKNLAPQQIVQYLQSVLVAEQVEFDEEALWQLARVAGGSMRDALTLLDQAISFGNGHVSTQAVTSLLGTPNHSLIFAIAGLLADRNGSGLVEKVAEAAEDNPDFSRLLEQMLGVFHRLALAQVMPEAVDNSEGDREQILALAGRYTPEDVQLYYQVCQQTLQEMAVTPDKRLSFEMALLRMLAFSPDVFMAGRLQVASDRQAATESTPTAAEETIAHEKKKPLNIDEPDPAGGQVPVADTVPDDKPDDSIAVIPEEERIPDGQVTADESLQQVKAEPAATWTEGTDWYHLVERCPLAGISGNILWNCLPESIEDEQYTLLLDENHSALYSADHDDSIAEALSTVLGRPVRVTIRIGALPEESPALRRQREKQAAIETVRQRFYKDPGVQALVDTFDARVEQDSLVIQQS